MTGLLARLGNVIYWLFTGLAVVWGVVGVITLISGQREAAEAVGGLALAIVFWGIGWVIRYILAGK